MDRSKILVVDDEPNIRKVIKARLEANDYEVVTASDGEEAIAKVKTEDPDLIILDVRMPKKDGFQVLEELRSAEPVRWRPIIMLTAESNPKDIFKGYQKEADLYVVKPFEWEKLISNVKVLLSVAPVHENASLIGQAIEKKRKQEEIEISPPITDVSKKRPASFEEGTLPISKNTGTRGLHLGKFKPYHGIALIISLLAVVLWGWWNLSSKKVLKEMDTRQVGDDIAPKVLPEVEKADEKPSEVVNYIHYKSGIKMAVINDRAVEIGDKIDGAIVEDISEDSVTLKKDGVSYVLKWDKSRVK